MKRTLSFVAALAVALAACQDADPTGLTDDVNPVTLQPLHSTTEPSPLFVYLDRSGSGNAPAADDFVVPAGTIWEVAQVTVITMGKPCDLRFFTWAGGVQTEIATYLDVGTTAVTEPITEHVFRHQMTLPTPLTLGPGHYWLGARGNCDPGAGFTWSHSATLHLERGLQLYADWSVNTSYSYIGFAFALYGWSSTAGTTAPTFTFDLTGLPAKAYGGAPFDVDGYTTTNSSGAISFATGPGSVGCSVTAGGTVTITGAAVEPARCILEASVAADATYSAAGPIAQSFNIGKAVLTVSARSETITYGDAPALGVDYSGFVGTDDAATLTGTLGYSFQGDAGTTYGPSPAPPTDAGLYMVLPTGLASANYGIMYNSGILTINRAAGSVNIANLPSSAAVGGSFTPSYTQLGDGTPSTVSSTPGTCTVTDGVVNFNAEGTCTLVASITEGTNHLAATGGAQSFTVNPAVVFSSACSFTVNPKNGSRNVTVTWENADPGVTLIQVLDGKLVQKQLAPTPSGSWNTSVKTGEPTYGLWGGETRKDASTLLVPAGSSCTWIVTI